MPLTLAIGELDADLTAIAALSPSNDDIIQRKAGAWTNRTVAQLVTDLLATGSFLRKAIVTLSSADILDLHNTPVTLVAAPGAGKFVIIHRHVEYLSHNGTDYVLTGNAPGLYYESTSGAFIVELASVASSSNRVATNMASVSSSATEVVNKPVVAAAPDAVTDGDGTLTVTVWYTIEDVPA